MVIHDACATICVENVISAQSFHSQSKTSIIVMQLLFTCMAIPKKATEQCPEQYFPELGREKRAGKLRVATLRRPQSRSQSTSAF